MSALKIVKTITVTGKNLVQYAILIFVMVFVATQTVIAATYSLSEEQNTTYHIPSYDDVLHIVSGGSIETTGNAHGVDAGEYDFDVNIDAADEDGIIVDNGYAITVNEKDISHFSVNLNSGKIYSNNKAIVFTGSGGATYYVTTINAATGTSISGRNNAIEIKDSSVRVDNAGVISSDNDAIYVEQSNRNYTTTIINSGEINGNITINDDHHARATLTNNAGTINGNITLGSGSASSITLNKGAINGNITLGHVDQTVNFNGATYLGTIQGNATSLGVVNVNDDMTLGSSSRIGDSYAIQALNINEGADFTANGSINVDTLNINAGGRLVLGSDNITVNSGLLRLEGVLDLGDHNRTLSSISVEGNGSSVIDFSRGSHYIPHISLGSGDSIIVDISQELYGNVTADLAALDSGVKLITTLGDDYQYVADGDKRKIIDGGHDSLINQIEDKNINTGKDFSVLNYSTSVEEEGDRKILYLHTSRAATSEITGDINAQVVYSSVNNIGSKATSELKDFQEYLDHATSQQQVTTALKSLVPQHDGGIIRNNINNVSSSAKILENRVNQQRLASLRPVAKPRIYKRNNAATKYGLTNNSTQSQKPSAPSNRSTFHSGKSFGDNANNKEIWWQAFGVSAKQKATTRDGYQSKSKGFAFGYGNKISKDSTIGINLSYADSIVESSDALKKTNVDTYQVNLYHGKNFNNYFFDTILGFAWNEFQSHRFIPVIGKNSQATFSGQTYLAKTTFGHAHYLGSGFSIIPQVSLNFIHNSIDGYQEKGAGTLGLEVASTDSNFLEGRVGMTLDHYFITVMGSAINTQIRTSYGYDFIGEEQSIRSNFVGQTATFNTAVSKIDRKSFMVGTGLSIVNRDNITINLDYNFEKKENYSAHSGLIKAKYGF